MLTRYSVFIVSFLLLPNCIYVLQRTDAEKLETEERS